jgi:hypothetical protein
MMAVTAVFAVKAGHREMLQTIRRARETVLLPAFCVSSNRRFGTSRIGVLATGFADLEQLQIPKI